MAETMAQTMPRKKTVKFEIDQVNKEPKPLVKRFSQINVQEPIEENPPISKRANTIVGKSDERSYAESKQVTDIQEVNSGLASDDSVAAIPKKTNTTLASNYD